MNTRSVALAQAYSSGAGVTADFDGDGNLDIAVVQSNSSGPQVSVELGNGHGSFGQPIVTQLTSTAGTTIMATADFNGDKKPDLLAADYFGQGFQVLLGQGNGSFSAPVDNTLSYTVNAFATGDFNNDGQADVVAVSSQNGSQLMGILLSNGDGTFTAGQQYIIYPNSNVAVADVNADGNLDLVVTSSYNLLVFLGNGDGTFKQPIFGSAIVAISAPVIADFNGDGKLDLAVGASNYPSLGMAFLAGNGDGTFQPPVLSDQQLLFQGLLSAGDFNGDGKLDILAGPGGCCGALVALLLPGNGDGTFGAPIEYDTFNNSFQGGNAFLVGDFNSDGVPDFGLGAVVGNGTQLALLYLSAAAADVSPAALNFGKVPVGKWSPPQNVNLTNSGNSVLKIFSILASGDFHQTNKCGKSLSPGKSCTIQVRFKPTAKGTRTGTLRLGDNAPVNPQRVSLTGKGQ